MWLDYDPRLLARSVPASNQGRDRFLKKLRRPPYRQNQSALLCLPCLLLAIQGEPMVRPLTRSRTPVTAVDLHLAPGSACAAACAAGVWPSCQRLWLFALNPATHRSATPSLRVLLAIERGPGLPAAPEPSPWPGRKPRW